MRLTLLDDLPSAKTLAVDDGGAVWLQFERGQTEVAPRWGRGCLTPDRERHAFLRPSWAVAWAPLTLGDYLKRFASHEAAT